MLRNILKRIILVGLFIIPFVPLFVSAHFFFPFITTKAFAWRIIVEVVLAAWLLLAYLDPVYRPKRSPILTALVAFVAVIGLADLFGANFLKSFWSNFERMEGYVTILHLGAFFIVAGSFFREREWKWWWNTSLAASFLVIIYSLFQLAGKIDIHQGGARVDATFGNAAYLAVYLLMNLFIAFFYMMRERETYLRALYGVLIVLQATILYETATRGAILGLIGGILLVALLNVRNNANRKIKKVSIATIAGVVIIIGGFFAVRHASFVQNSAVLARFASISSAELKTEGRSFVWPIALKGIGQKPLLGFGQENFPVVFDEYYSPQMFHLEPWFDRAHNIFLDWGVAGGLLGLLGYLALYVAVLVAIWKRDTTLTYFEKSVFTGLLAAYFFHNFFVFDNLMSYILFFALLAYIHSHVVVRSNEVSIPAEREKLAAYYAAPVAIAFIALVYFANVKPIRANIYLIDALQAVQSSDAAQSTAFGYFREAYGESYLGRGEVVEWIAQSAPQILGNEAITLDDRNSYYSFAKAAVEKQADDSPKDARYQILAGTFLTETGYIDEGRTYLDKAEVLIPGKQVSYFEEGAGLIGQKKYKEAEAVFKKAYDMAPDYQEAEIVYLVGAIYAGDTATGQTLIAQIPPSVLVADNRVTTALYTTNQFSDLLVILQKRLESDTGNPQNYVDLAVVLVKVGQKTNAINVLKEMEKNIPSTKDQAETYIQGIQKGTI